MLMMVRLVMILGLGLLLVSCSKDVVDEGAVFVGELAGFIGESLLSCFALEGGEVEDARFVESG